MLSLNSSGIYCAIVIPLSHSLSPIGLSLFMGLLINPLLIAEFTNIVYIINLFSLKASLAVIP